VNYIILILSVLIGSLLVFIVKPSTKVVRLLLAFSGAYLLSVTILHLLPEVYTITTDYKTVGIFILAQNTGIYIFIQMGKAFQHYYLSVYVYMLFLKVCQYMTQMIIYYGQLLFIKFRLQLYLLHFYYMQIILKKQFLFF